MEENEAKPQMLVDQTERAIGIATQVVPNTSKNPECDPLHKLYHTIKSYLDVPCVGPC